MLAFNKHGHTTHADLVTNQADLSSRELFQLRVVQLHPMPAGNVFERGWIRCMLGLHAGQVLDFDGGVRVRGVLAGQVLNGDGGDVGGDVQGVPDAYLLQGGEQQEWQLHMQRGLYGGGRGGVYGMRGGHLQGGEWIGAVLLVCGGEILWGGG